MCGECSGDIVFGCGTSGDSVVVFRVFFYQNFGDQKISSRCFG